jgi:hypothetical protein
MIMKGVSLTLACAVMAIASSSCVRFPPPTKPTAAVPGASLWVQPADLPSRDLFYGPWGRDDAPDPRDTFKLIELKHTGINPGMTVADSHGREWSVKQPIPGGIDYEGSVEVVVSRLLSAIGYHQPPVYFLPTFNLKDGFETRVETGGRFRLKAEGLKDTGPWSWQDNPFVGSRPYDGLLALLMMFNSTDLKNSNNTLYERQRGDRIERWYAVRDVGAALGDLGKFSPTKGDPAGFEQQPYILGVQNGVVEFAYQGWYKNLVLNRITTADVAWASDLLAQLSDRQWHDAFRAGGYGPNDANRFIRKLREKIRQGQELGRRAATQ